MFRRVTFWLIYVVWHLSNFSLPAIGSIIIFIGYAVLIGETLQPLFQDCSDNGANSNIGSISSYATSVHFYWYRQPIEHLWRMFLDGFFINFLLTESIFLVCWLYIGRDTFNLGRYDYLWLVVLHILPYSRSWNVNIQLLDGSSCNVIRTNSILL